MRIFSSGGRGANVTKESQAHEEMFHINNLYAGYKDKVSKLYAKGYKLNDSVVKFMSAAFGLKPSPSDILAYLSDEISLKENDIHKEPLMKLKQDTIKQMHDGGVID